MGFMGFSRTQSIYVALSPEHIWDLLTDPHAWVQFDDQLQHFSPEAMAGNRLDVGDRVKVVPKALLRGFLHAATAPAATIVTVEPEHELAWRQDQPGGHTKQRWMLEPADDNGTTLTRHIEVVGPLAAPLGAALAAPLTADLGVVGARMMRMASDGPDREQPLNIIAGGSGYLGSRLATRLLASGQRAVVLTRSPKTDAPYPQVRWGADDLEPLHEQLLDDAGFNIINLVGKRIGNKLTAQEIQKLTASRVEPLATLRAAVERAQAQGGKLHRWIQGSAVPLWHPESTREFTETTSPTAAQDGAQGMGQIVSDWETAAPEGATMLRTGVVIGQATEITYGLTAMALSRTRPSVDGYLPWIHEDDWVRLVQHLLSMSSPPETVVAVAPQQTRLSEAIHALAPGLGTRTIPLPTLLLRTGMTLIGMEPGMLLGSTRARSEIVEELGFEFRFPTIAQAADAVRV